MQLIPATEVKNHLGQVMNMAAQEPVTISKNGVPSLVMMSLAEYERIKKEDRLEEFFSLCKKARKEAKSNKISKEILQSILNDQE